MLPTQTSLAIQTDILPTQNIGLLDQNQPQIYSLLANSNSPNSTKKSRRKKPTKLDEAKPVMVNPQITRTLTGVTFTTPHHRSTSLSESISSFVTTRVVNDHRLPFRLCLDHNSCDANNNINSNQIPSITMSLNPSLPVQMQQIPSCGPAAISTNSIPQLVAKSQLFGVNQSLDNTMNERTVPIPSLQQNKHNYLQSSLTFADQGSRRSHSPSVPSGKCKRKYSKRQNLSVSVEQQQLAQQTSGCATTFTQSNVSNGLPSIIPATVIDIPTKSEEHPLPLDILTASNYNPLTPPGSIKSPPTNIINELSLIPAQQNLLSFTTTNVTEMNQYCPTQWYSYPRKINWDSSVNNSPYHLHRFLTTTPAQYCMVPPNLIPTNILPMAYSSILPETVGTNLPVSIPNCIKNQRGTREKSTRKSKTMQRPVDGMLGENGSFTSKSLTTDISAHKRLKHKDSGIKDIRTKKQLRRITRQNRLAILKFMIRKRKQQKQQSVSIPQLPDTVVEQMPPESIRSPTSKPEEMKTNLPDIIAPSLKIFFDATQKIESIVLYYHRRCKPDPTYENSLKLLDVADNRLDLLVEAVDFLETQQGHLNLTSATNQ